MKAINLIKKELKENINCEYESYDNGDKSDDVLKGWIEALEYCLGVIDRKIAVTEEEK